MAFSHLLWRLCVWCVPSPRAARARRARRLQHLLPRLHELLRAQPNGLKARAAGRVRGHLEYRQRQGQGTHGSGGQVQQGEQPQPSGVSADTRAVRHRRVRQAWHHWRRLRLGQPAVRRQPAASDLRMVLAVSRVVRDLERMGDEAAKIAIHALEVANGNQAGSKMCNQSIRHMGSAVIEMISDALDAFARHDIEGAIDVVRSDKMVDEQYASAIRELSTYMMEDPRSIGQAINILWILRAIERIGDHARNISEQVIYLVSGADVRHSSLSEMEEQAQIDPQS